MVYLIKGHRRAEGTRCGCYAHGPNFWEESSTHIQQTLIFGRYLSSIIYDDLII